MSSVQGESAGLANRRGNVKGLELPVRVMEPDDISTKSRQQGTPVTVPPTNPTLRRAEAAQTQLLIRSRAWSSRACSELKFALHRKC